MITFAHALNHEVLSIYEHDGRGYNNRISVRVTGDVANGYNECHIAGALPTVTLTVDI